MLRSELNGKTIDILGQNWNIVLTNNLVDENNDLADGLCDEQKLTIFLNSNVPDERIKEVLLHEIIHVVDSVFSLELSETQVTKLARGLFGVLRPESLRKRIFDET
jgi:uncharacterized protein YjaZ